MSASRFSPLREFVIRSLLSWSLLFNAAAWAGYMPLKIFDGAEKVVIVHGYSTSFRWPDLLERKLDRYFDGNSPLKVEKATAGGTPIARWMDVTTGDPKEPWLKVLRPRLEAAGSKPAIVLCQQSLQWVFGDRQAGIRNAEDAERIRQGAAAIEKYANLLQADGADLIFIAMHIYKHPMEPEIGNERLALAEYLKRRGGEGQGREGIKAGPDVWAPTKTVYPWGFARDTVHPGKAANEIMAHCWFAALLEHDGLPVPKWSEDEMKSAIDADRETATGQEPASRR